MQVMRWSGGYLSTAESIFTLGVEIPGIIANFSGEISEGHTLEVCGHGFDFVACDMEDAELRDNVLRDTACDKQWQILCDIATCHDNSIFPQRPQAANIQERQSHSVGPGIQYVNTSARGKGCH